MRFTLGFEMHSKSQPFPKYSRPGTRHARSHHKAKRTALLITTDNTKLTEVQNNIKLKSGLTGKSPFVPNTLYIKPPLHSAQPCLCLCLYSTFLQHAH